MKYALVDGVREEAKPGLRGVCPGCAAPMLAKCGAVKLHHWAHKSRVECDHWWEPETEWHRGWKNQFPSDWQEVRHRATDGGMHIADVRTPNGAVLEFQYSAIHPDELQSRELFYGPQMAWVVSGTRLKRDLETFAKIVRNADPDYTSEVRAWLVFSYTAQSILKRWAKSRRRVFLDFGAVDFSPLGLSAAELVWRVDFGVAPVRITPLMKDGFIKHYREGSAMVGFVSHAKLLEMSMSRRSMPRYGRRHRRF